MNPIPDLGLPPSRFDPKTAKVRFRFSLMRKNGRGSRKEFRHNLGGAEEALAHLRRLGRRFREAGGSESSFVILSNLLF